MVSVCQADERIAKELQVGSVLEVEEMASLVEEWEMVSVEEVAMSAVMSNAKGIEPMFEEAKKRLDWLKWKEAIEVELKLLKNNGTWTVIERPSNANVVNSKWVFRIKKNSAGRSSTRC